MDHPCHNCGQTIEEGKAFCPQCGAPQIRVMMPEPDAGPVPYAATSAVEGDVKISLPPAVSLHGARRFAMQAPALAALVALGMTVLGLNPFVAALGAGVLAVTFSLRRNLGGIAPSAGAKIGAVSGVALFAISAIFETLAVALLHKGAEVRGEMLEKVQQAAARYPGPEVQPFIDFVKTPNGFTVMLVASLVFGLIAFVVLGSLGGMVGAAIFGRRGRL